MTIEIIENRDLQPFLDKITPYVDLSKIKCFMDIGARDCIESVGFARRFPDANIYSFEPNPFQKEICLEVIGPYKNIEFSNCALSNFEGESTFHVTVGNIAASSLLRPHHVPWAADQSVTQVKVPVTTLDSWRNNRPIDPCVIWMDVQGNELNVFKGGVETLKSVKAIYCEAGIIPYYDGHTLKDDIIKFLEEQGFKLLAEEFEGQARYEINLTLVRK